MDARARATSIPKLRSDFSLICNFHFVTNKILSIFRKNGELIGKFLPRFWPDFSFKKSVNQGFSLNYRLIFLEWKQSATPLTQSHSIVIMELAFGHIVTRWRSFAFSDTLKNRHQFFQDFIG